MLGRVGGPYQHPLPVAPCDPLLCRLHGIPGTLQSGSPLPSGAQWCGVGSLPGPSPWQTPFPLPAHLEHSWSLVSKPHLTPYPCRGCAGGRRGTREGSLHLIHLGVSTPGTEGASGTFVGQREQISSPHQPGVRGCAPPTSFTVAFKRGFSWGRGSPGLWGLHTLTPTRLAQACPSPGCWLSPGPDSGSLCRHLDLTSGRTSADRQQRP